MDRDFAHNIVLALWVLEVFGFPMAWKKCQGGFTVTWIGFELALKSYALGVSERRAAWALSWFEKVLSNRMVLGSELTEALGRLGFVFGALLWDRPFLAPLYAFAALLKPGACVPLPVFVFTILSWLRDRLKKRRHHPCTARPPAGSLFRVDAKAEGAAITVAGWRPHADADGTIRKELSPCFAVELSEATAPWAYTRGEPYRVISALELLASTIALMVFGPAECLPEPCTAAVSVTGETDSQVATSVVAKGASTSFPLCAVAMELASQLEARSATLSLEWAPRYLNKVADALTNGNFAGFDPGRRRHVDFAGLPWLYLPSLLSEGQAFYAETAKARAERKGARNAPGARNRPRGDSTRLRFREPW